MLAQSYLKNVQADIAKDVHIGMKAGGFKLDFWWLKGILIGKRQGQSILSPFKHCIFTPTDRPFPVENVAFFRKSRNTRIPTHLKQNSEIRNTWNLLLKAQRWMEENSE